MSRMLEKSYSIIYLAAICLAAMLGCALPSYADEGPIPGPALESRQKLFDRIQQAKSQGIGISGYLQAFKTLEDQVKAGDPADKINSRVVAINKAVNDQIERAKILKTQKPIAAQGSQVSGSAPPSSSVATPAAASTPPVAAGGGNSDMMAKLKEKFGDKIPDNLKEKLMNDPSIIEKIKERAGQK